MYLISGCLIAIQCGVKTRGARPLCQVIVLHPVRKARQDRTHCWPDTHCAHNHQSEISPDKNFIRLLTLTKKKKDASVERNPDTNPGGVRF